MFSRKAILTIFSLVLLVAVLAVGWYLASPLFFHNTAQDSNPFAQSPSPTGTLSSKETPTATSTPELSANGTFIDSGDPIHRGKGSVIIGKTPNGTYAMHFADFFVTNGPDLFVFLSRQEKPQNGQQVTEGGYNLGSLKATEGAVTIPVPAEVAQSLQNYKSVVIYCKAYSVIFTVAPLHITGGAAK